MFHIFWLVFCIALGKALAVYLYSFTSFTTWTAIIVTAVICMIPGIYLSWYLYWIGRVICAPISNLFFKNPVAPKKRLIDGITIRACYALAMLSIVAAPIYFFLPPETIDTYFVWIALAFLGIWMALTHIIKHHPGLFIWIAKLTRDFPREDVRRAQRGDGGDAQFAGFWKEWDYPWIPNTILLGQSLYGKHWVGFKDLILNLSDDRHIITMAGSRAGKGISRIIVNLLLWWHNAIIIDPKGENAAITAHNSIRAQAYVIDPYGMVKNVFPRGEDPSSSKTPPIRAKYNPLQDIDPFSPTAIETIKVLLEAIVYSQSAANKQWERTPKTIIGGVIGHVLTAEEFQEERSLVIVYRLLNGSDDELKQLVIRMRENRAMGDYIPNGGNALEMAIRESRQSFKSAVVTSLEWITYPKMQELIGGESDFSMMDIATNPMSIYLCFDIEKLEQQSQFVRIFFLMAFHAMINPRGGTKTKKVLFLMDEFFTLGYLPMLEKGAQYIAGEGIKLWPIIQNISMIESLYGKTWSNFIEAAGVVEAFGLSSGDNEGTAHWVHKKLGESRSANLKLGDAAKSMDTLSLMTQSELEQEFRREDDRSIVFIKGADPMVLRRKPYWELFHPSMYKAPPQGVPLNAMQRKIMEKTGWTHTRYFGSNSTTLKAMGTPFDEPQRIQEINARPKTASQSSNDRSKQDAPPRPKLAPANYEISKELKTKTFPPFEPFPIPLFPTTTEAQIAWALDLFCLEPDELYTAGELGMFHHYARYGKWQISTIEHPKALEIAHAILKRHCCWSENPSRDTTDWHEYQWAHRQLDLSFNPPCTQAAFMEASERRRNPKINLSSLGSAGIFIQCGSSADIFTGVLQPKFEPEKPHLPLANPKPYRNYLSKMFDDLGVPPKGYEDELYSFAAIAPTFMRFGPCPEILGHIDQSEYREATKPEKAKKSKKDKAKKKKETLKKVKKSKVKQPQPVLVTAEAPAPLEEPVFEEMTVEEAREYFGYVEDEIPTWKDLRDRYTRASKATDSKAVQEVLDEAYQALLKIAA